MERNVLLGGRYRELLPDTSSINFIHGDLTLENIRFPGRLASGRSKGSSIGNRRVGNLEYWEYYMLLYGVQYEHV